MVLANIFGGDGLIVIIVALVVIFGGSQLPKIARNVGSAGREFKKAQQEADAEARAEAAAKAAAATTPTVPPPTAVPPVTPSAPVPPVTPSASVPPVTVPPTDSVTLSRADLEALLEERARRGGDAGSTH
ncbi:MAG TPA: twin-arginine translocase TatA/TatE family subunit [Acidimicrobiales bacterium]|nr:twin-arginine translocase TatA/TatE family subunit [Acidimicrobiales bacterium]